MANGEGPVLERAGEDSPEDRRSGLARFYGTAPTTYEAISELSRNHTRNAPADANATGWLPLGPRNVGGAVRCIAQNPARPAELLAGSAQAGVWKSTDDGYSWRPTGGPDLFGSVCAIAYAPGDARRVYAATGELSYNYPGGIGFFRSTDGGETFERMVDARQTDPGSASQYARIVVDPADATRAWIASTRGLWRLEGNTFRAEALPGAAAGAAVTDVAVVADPGNPNQYIVLAGVSGVGVARGIFNRKNRSTAWTVVGPAAPAPWAAGVGAVRIAWSAATPPVAYAVMEQQPGVAALNGFPSLLFNSTDLGVTWTAPGGASTMETQSAIAWYVLSLAVNPRNPAHIVGGCVDVRNSIDGGVNWTTLLDWTQYDLRGDRAQHADQSAILFDAQRPNAVWVANDGGISFCANITAAPPVWRKRSYGLSAAQLFDITTHPRFPGLCGGGMQDNGTFVSYGGPTWYRLSGGDGGALGFHPTSPFRFYTSNQAGIDRADVSQFPPPGAPVPRPQHAFDLPGIAPPANVHAPFRFRLQGVAPPGGFFMRALEAHPTNPDFVLLGAANAVQYATDGVNFVTANTPGRLGNITAAAFAAIGTDMWAGSDQGEVFVNGAALPPSSGGGAQPAWTRSVPGAGPVTAIAVHPANASVVAVATGLGGGVGGNIFLSHDRGAHWDSIIGAAGALPPSPYLALAFDPSTMGTLFAGTISGVYVTRDLPAVALVPGAVPNPTWRTFNAGLPLVPITDLSVSPVTRTLRCATFGRGAFECSLSGATPAKFALPAVSLVVRNHAADDGRTYADLNTLGGDPRIGTTAAPPAPPPPPPAAAPDAAGPIDITRSPDIRVDSPRFTRSEAFAFGEAIDGAEFDEVLVRDEPLVGDTNIVYVQVQNRGTEPAINVDVHLYFADAGTPPAAPDVPADLGFPNAPPAASPWQRADTITVGEIRPGEPAVVSFRWIPPLAIREHVALFVAVSNATDLLAAIPAGPVAPFVLAERRAALHVTHVQRDTIFIRDGLDDTGERGAVAWGGRSPDISVRQAQVAAANLATEFANLATSHAADRVRAGQNFVYVRVNNRTQVAIPFSTVRLFQIPRSAIATPGAGWRIVPPAAGVIINGIAAGGFGIAEFPFTPVSPDPDPEGGVDGKGLIFLAMANVIDGAGREVDPFPETGDITDVATFWRFFTGAPLATNAAMRAIRFAP